MTTNASIGYGTVLRIALASAPTAFTHIREVFEITPPSQTDENVKVSHFQSPNRTHEYIPGWTEPGEAAAGMNYVPGSPTDLFLISIKGKALISQVIFPNGVRIQFNSSRGAYETDIPNEDKMSATLGLKVSGDPTQSAAAAPINLVAPSITGTAQVGQVLTVDPGEWAGAQVLTYQWQQDDAGNGTFTNIADATGQTLVLAAGQQGDVVRVVVTAANASAFTTAANSAATDAVAAA